MTEEAQVAVDVADKSVGNEIACRENLGFNHAAGQSGVTEVALIVDKHQHQHEENVRLSSLQQFAAMYEGRQLDNHATGSMRSNDHRTIQTPVTLVSEVEGNVNTDRLSDLNDKPEHEIEGDRPGHMRKL